MSTSPRWDSRNQGFVPPTQLRKTRISPATMPVNEAGELAPKSQHTRTSSFFSFGSKKSAQQHAQQAVRTVEQRSPSLSPGHGQAVSTDSSMHVKRPSLGENSLPSPNPAIQREIRSVVDLALAHAHKIYFSGPLVRRVERQPDGSRPARDDGWVDVWAQLGGTTLSVWDMKAIEEASKRGEEVPPSYINVTDSFIQVLGALTSPATATAPAKRFTNVITLNTAGSNLILLACPSSMALISWSAALRLASWEKSRLEEIYTGHLLRMTLSEGDPWKEPASTLIRGKLEGQVKVRVAGQTDWKPLWMVVSGAGDPANLRSASMSRRPTLERTTSPSSTVGSKKRMSSLFSRSGGQSPPPQSSSGTVVPTITLYASNKGKDLKRPLLTIRHVSQAFAVYPERVEVISRSTLFKIEGLLGEEDLAGPMKGKQAWLMVMPETTQVQPVFELLRWLVAIHDSFSLYGRAPGYIWDPRQPPSLWFAYPVGPQRAQLFLEREIAENLDPRDDRTSIIRKNLKEAVIQRMFGSSSPPGQSPPPIGQATSPLGQAQNTVPRTDAAPVLPPVQSMERDPPRFSPQLPPLNFNDAQSQQPPAGPGPGPGQGQGAPRAQPVGRGMSSLTPITERSPIEPQNSTSSNAPSGERRAFAGSPPPGQRATPVNEGSQASRKFFDEPVHKSPIMEARNGGVRRGSEDSYTGSRQDSKLALSTSYTPTGYVYSDGAALAEGQSPLITKSHTDRKPLSPSTRTSSILTSNSVASPPLSQGALSPSRLGSRTQSPTVGSVHSPQVLSEVSTSTSKEPQGRSSPASNVQIAASPVQSLRSPASQPPPSPPPKNNIGVSVSGKGYRDSSPPTDAEQSPDLASSAGALYLLQQRAEQAPPPPPRDTWTTSEDDEGIEEQESETSGPERNPPPRRGGTPPVLMQPPSPQQIVSESQRGSHAATSRSNLGRKPSGARAKPGPRRYGEKPAPLEPHAESQAGPSSPPTRAMERSQSYSGHDDNADALAALTFLEQEEAPPMPPMPRRPHTPPAPVKQAEPSPPPSESHHYPSSFAPSKQAAERKAKAQAQQEATYAATHLPGKPNGKSRKKAGGAWAESSDEEDEDDEDEDEDEGSDEDAPPRVRQPQPLPASDPRVSVYPSAQPGSHSQAPSSAGDHGQSKPRTLPLPPNRGGGSPYDSQNPHSRVASGQYDDRPRTHVGDEPKPHPMSSHQAARQSVWSTVLDPQPPPRNTGRDTFVQMDQSETMTKAFQPQGLLSAGLQDKEDRSAKRQEEHARETGASLINVPNKPPPPQTGLLGAITAHERERKREGGVGATLTERERERRLAEERQRKLDDLQRLQIDQLSQGGGQGAGYDPYGQQQFAGYGQGFDPRMSMNPMMLNPYMAGGFPMMPYGNPQQMMAAQLAAQQAYQQAMMSFSQQGSQMGDNMSRAGAPTPVGASTTPLGTPPIQGGGMMGQSPSPMQGGMMGMDPRMSMMSPMGMMMGSGMGGGMGMNPMMGMGMGMGQNFDPRMSMSPGQPNYFQRPDSRQGGVPPGTPSPRQGSPAPAQSGNNSPRPHHT